MILLSRCGRLLVWLVSTGPSRGSGSLWLVTKPALLLYRYVLKTLHPDINLSLVQHAFENLEPEAKDGIVDELLNQGAAVFGEVVKNQWGSYCVQHSTSSLT